MPTADDDAVPVVPAEAQTLFADLVSAPALILAISGGPDSTALLMLAAHWRASLKDGPSLTAVTVDHGLRAESAREATQVKRLAARLGVRHRTLHWTGRKPATGLQEAARTVRYRLLAAAVREAGATHVLTAHTLDDQAETVLLRMARGSGLTGLGAMARTTRIHGLLLVRPFLDLPKTRLIATLDAAGLASADDPSNRDPRFTRPRLRQLMPALAGEGLDARKLALLAHRLRRAEATIEVAVDAAASAVSESAWSEGRPVVLDAGKFARLPAEVALRLLGRAIARVGDEGPVQLGKLETLCAALIETNCDSAAFRLRRTLAGALITLSRERLQVERAPPRTAKIRRARKTLTTRKQAAAEASDRR